jgi:phage-related protein (TIGR01555 family)
VSKKKEAKRAAKKVAKKAAKPRVPEKAAAAPKITDEMLARSRVKPSNAKTTPLAPVNAFELTRQNLFPPSAMPKEKKHQLAMDDALQQTAGWAGAIAAASWSEGLQFLGYPYLAELAQRPEYRVIVEIIATELTRKWIKLEASGDGEGDASDKSDKIKKLNDALDKFKVRDIIKQHAINDGFFGRSHIFIDIGKANLENNIEELITPIGNGRNALSKSKMKKGALNRFANIEPIWVYPTNYNATDPTKADWYSPEQWFVMSKPMHATRLLTGIGRPVPDLLKPAYAFGGLSLSQMAKPYVDNWLATRQSVNDIISAFSVFVLATDLSTLLMNDGDLLFKRADLFNNLRNNRGLMMINKTSEDFKNVAASLATLDMLQAQSQEHMAAVSRIPIVKLLGIQPAGLNASSEGEIQSFYDSISAFQESFVRPVLTTMIDFVQLSEFGEVDQDIIFSFNPLESINEKEIAETEKVKAETDNVRIEGGVISQEEARERVANDPQSGYNSIDVSDMPDLLEEEEEGLEPKGAAAQLAEGGAENDNDKSAPKKAAANDIAMDELKGEIQFALDIQVRNAKSLRTRLNALIPIAKAAGLAQDAHSLELKLADYYDCVAKAARLAGNKTSQKNARAKAAKLRNS